MKDDRVYLNHILKCISRIDTEVAKGEAEFRSSETVRDAIVLNLAIMGEAIKRLSPETRARSPRLPWGQVAKLRDILIHKYDQVDLHEIWDIARLDVPPFKAQVQQLVQAMSATAADGTAPDAGSSGEIEG